jgi:1,4-dihydroxy-2-naphthoyl-CoA hydrolase
MTQLATQGSAGTATAAHFEELGRGLLPGLLGIKFESVEAGLVHSRLPIERQHMAPNGFLHAASVIALADTSCGYGCATSLPAGATGFTTIELKSNFMGTATAGDVVSCRAWLVHGGRTTQVWDAEVTGEDGRTLALFRCTQMVLYPKPGPTGVVAA